MLVGTELHSLSHPDVIEITPDHPGGNVSSASEVGVSAVVE